MFGTQTDMVTIEATISSYTAIVDACKRQPSHEALTRICSERNVMCLIEMDRNGIPPRVYQYVPHKAVAEVSKIGNL